MAKSQEKKSSTTKTSTDRPSSGTARPHYAPFPIDQVKRLSKAVEDLESVSPGLGQRYMELVEKTTDTENSLRKAEADRKSRESNNSHEIKKRRQLYCFLLIVTALVCGTCLTALGHNTQGVALLVCSLGIPLAALGVGTGGTLLYKLIKRMAKAAAEDDPGESEVQ